MRAQKIFNVDPIDATFGAVITGIDLKHIDAATTAKLYDTWLEFGLLIFPDQHLSNAEQVTFAKRFGEMEFDLAPISNVKADGSLRQDDGDDVVKILKGNMGWHCDSTYMPVQAKGAVFTAHVVPESGGETGWADLRAGYDALDDTMKNRIANLAAYHSLYYSQQKAGYDAGAEGDFEKGDITGYGFFGQEPPLRPLVKAHPETGRKSLQVGRHAYGIPGMSETASESLLKELVDFTCQAPRIYHHSWTPGDAVLWDNRCLMHQACPWNMAEPRVMYHSRIAGDPVSEFAAPD